jgi:RNA polymerase sigma factor (TIGR02999 family)
MDNLTHRLSDIEQGDPQAADQVLPLVYDELRRLAAQKLAHEKSGHTLEATALVHEAYLRLVGQQEPRSYRDRPHFFAAAPAMRRILIESIRRKRTRKRSGEWKRQPLEAFNPPEPDDELLALDRPYRGWPRSTRRRLSWSSCASSQA